MANPFAINISPYAFKDWAGERTQNAFLSGMKGMAMIPEMELQQSKAAAIQNEMMREKGFEEAMMAGDVTKAQAINPN